MQGVEVRIKKNRNVLLQPFPFWRAVLLCLTITGPVCAQQTGPLPSPAQPDAKTDDAGDLMPVRRKHPSVSRTAEFQGPGILQLEYGYDGNFHSSDLRADHQIMSLARKKWVREGKFP